MIWLYSYRFIEIHTCSKFNCSSKLIYRWLLWDHVPLFWLGRLAVSFVLNYSWGWLFFVMIVVHRQFYFLLRGNILVINTGQNHIPCFFLVWMLQFCQKFFSFYAVYLGLRGYANRWCCCFTVIDDVLLAENLTCTEMCQSNSLVADGPLSYVCLFWHLHFLWRRILIWALTLTVWTQIFSIL